MTESKNNSVSKDVSVFFDGYAHDFSSIYKEDTKKRSSFDKFMDKLFRKDIEDRFDRTVHGINKDSISSVLDIGFGVVYWVAKTSVNGVTSGINYLFFEPVETKIDEEYILMSDFKTMLDEKNNEIKKLNERLNSKNEN